MLQMPVVLVSFWAICTHSCRWARIVHLMLPFSGFCIVTDYGFEKKTAMSLLKEVHARYKPDRFFAMLDSESEPIWYLEAPRYSESARAVLLLLCRKYSNECIEPENKPRLMPRIGLDRWGNKLEPIAEDRCEQEDTRRPARNATTNTRRTGVNQQSTSKQLEDLATLAEEGCKQEDTRRPARSGMASTRGTGVNQRSTSKQLEEFARLGQSRTQNLVRNRRLSSRGVALYRQVSAAPSIASLTSLDDMLSVGWESIHSNDGLLYWDGLLPMTPMPTLFPYYESTGTSIPGFGSTVRSLGTSCGRTRSCEMIQWGRNLCFGSTVHSLGTSSGRTRSCEMIRWRRTLCFGSTVHSLGTSCGRTRSCEMIQWGRNLCFGSTVHSLSTSSGRTRSCEMIQWGRNL
jgi:hypothetical protein